MVEGLDFERIVLVCQNRSCRKGRGRNRARSDIRQGRRVVRQRVGLFVQGAGDGPRRG